MARPAFCASFTKSYEISAHAFVLVLLAFGGMVLLARHDTTLRADADFKKLTPVTASFSRVRGDKKHLLSVYWRLHFAQKRTSGKQTIAFWSLRPFRHVTMVTK